jgi:hypothetical protein
MDSLVSRIDPMRTNELRDAIAAMRAAECHGGHRASIDAEAARVELLAALEELASAWEHSAALAAERYCALEHDIDGSLHAVLSEMEQTLARPHRQRVRFERREERLMFCLTPTRARDPVPQRSMPVGPSHELPTPGRWPNASPRITGIEPFTAVFR